MNKSTPENFSVTACLQLANSEPVTQELNVANFRTLFKASKRMCKDAGVPKPFKQHQMCIVYENASKQRIEVTDDATLMAAAATTQAAGKLSVKIELPNFVHDPSAVAQSCRKDKGIPRHHIKDLIR